MNAMNRPQGRGWLWAGLLFLTLTLALAGCGGGNGGDPAASTPPPPADDPLLSQGSTAAPHLLLQALPALGTGGSGGSTDRTTLTVHYKRLDGDTSGWQLHSWGAAQDPGWNSGHNPSGSDSFGAIYQVPLVASSGTVGYLFHKGDTKDHGGTDQSYTLKAGRNEIWRIEGDPSTYSANPSGAALPDLKTVRVHYKRYDANYAAWGLHLWDGSGLDVSRLAGLNVGNWGAPVPLAQMPGYSAGSSEVVFDLPVLNPQGDASRKTVEFIIHGLPPREGDKDGRAQNIRVDYAALLITNQIGEVWLVQQDATVYSAAPDTRSVSASDARAVWLNRSLIQWPRVDAGGVHKLYHSATGQIVVAKDAKLSGADGALVLSRSTAAVPAAVAERFKYVAPGVVLGLKDGDQARLGELLKQQLVLVQEDANGLVQNATTVQLAGALDDLYASAAALTDLGATVAGGSTRFKLWAPTAQAVRVYTYAGSSGDPLSVDLLTFDAATGVWSLSKAADLSGRYYRYAVDVFVRGKGLLRNFVTDPYSVSLGLDSARSYIASLDAAALKPAGWDQSAPPATVSRNTDMSIYELHLRDFAATDTSVPAEHRGKYLAFTDASSRGMQHLKALAAAGLTDVHLLPVFDLGSVPESGCSTPAISGAPDAETQQAAVASAAAGDCFNWGYDPYHYGAPEGSYASDAADGAKRILEFRQMVMGLNAAGLRVGMDVVYNHTVASGQDTVKSVLDRVVPGYYHRLNASGGVETSTCCDNTATENLMMGKLMIDTAIRWARDYHISSFRFDIMGHQPRAVMEQLKAAVAAAAGRPVQLIGEGWNFGEVMDGARFVQASMGSLNGSGIGSFNPFIRDAVRGGSPFDSGNALIANQGWINGLYLDPNAQSGGRSRNDLMWQGDLIKSGLAGSIKSFPLQTHWDAHVTLEQLNGAGYVAEPGEAVNYIENHDNQTLFDINAWRLPQGSSRMDRARVQVLGAAINAFSQGVAYFHAGVDVLRSKSLDRNSYDAGDWFNRLDWSYQDNGWGSGLPMKSDNGDSWALMKPLLADASIKPGATEIAWTRDAFRDLLRIRASSSLFRLPSAAEIRQRLRFHNTGSGQQEALIVGQLEGRGLAGAGFQELVYVFNADKKARSVDIPALQGKGYHLHPVHLASAAADARIAAEAHYDSGTGRFTVPARSAVVFVIGN